MRAESRVHLIEVPVAGNEGTVWNRLHSEREDICEAILKDSPDNDVSSASWHRELLQARLRKIDDALDRLMSGSYGNCSKCGRWIEDTKLEFDPAIAFCLDCWAREVNKIRAEHLAGEQHTQQLTSSGGLVDLAQANHPDEGLLLTNLSPFDTVRVQTHNSDYRIFLLDPKTGRALVEGGSHFPEPVEAVVYGSTLGSSMPRVGWIGIGYRIEMWINENILSTSPVKSVKVERHSSGEVLPVHTSLVS